MKAETIYVVGMREKGKEYKPIGDQWYHKRTICADAVALKRVDIVKEEGKYKPMKFVYAGDRAI